MLKNTPKFIETWPPTSEDFCVDTVKKSIPPLVYNFVAWATGKSDSPGNNYITLNNPKDETVIMSIAQDLIYHGNKGNNPTPKSMTLAMAVRQITGSE